jgi:hypothetical protein
MPEQFKIYEWIFEKGLSVGLVIYFVFWFTQKIDPKLTSLIDGINRLLSREEERSHSFETVITAKTQTAETVSRIETKVDRIEGELRALSVHTQRLISQ